MNIKSGDWVEIIKAQKGVSQMNEMIGQIFQVNGPLTPDSDWFCLVGDCFVWHKDWLKPVDNFEINENEFDGLFDV